MKHESEISFTDSAKLEGSLNLLAARNEEAFKMLYTTFRTRLFRYAATFGLSGHDAESVAIDTLLDFCAQAKKFARLGDEYKASGVEPYLFRIARNKAVSQFRKKYAYSERVQEDPDGELTNLMPDPMSVVLAMEVEQDKEGVKHCLDRLNLEQRDAVVLVYWKGFSLSEVATTQGSELGTVKSRIFNAKVKLKKCFETWINGGRYER